MKFETSLYPYHSFGDLADVTAYVCKAEALGYDVVAVPDHIAYSADHEHGLGGPYWDAITVAAHLGTVTETIHLAFSAIVLPLRNPVQLAREIATLDAITAGRLEVGLALGWLQEEFDFLGSDFHTRGARFDEYLQVMFRLWTPGPVSFDGDFVKLTDVATNPLPVQRPHPFIWIGSSPPSDEHHVPKSLKRAAAHADGWMPAMGTLDMLRTGIRMLREELVRNGREDRIDGFQVFQRLGVWNRPDEVGEHVVATGGALGERLGGDMEKTIDFIGQAQEAGITQISVELPLDSPSARIEGLEQFAEQVISPMRSSA